MNIHPATVVFSRGPALYREKLCRLVGSTEGYYPVIYHVYERLLPVSVTYFQYYCNNRMGKKGSVALPCKHVYSVLTVYYISYLE